MTDDQCEICGQPATVHAVMIDDHRKSERHLCAQHAKEAGMRQPHAAPGQAPGAGVICGEAIGALDNVKGTANFLRRHGRMPESVEELLQGMADPGDAPPAPLSDPKLARGLQFMEGMIRFWEAHGRPPMNPEEAASVGLEWDKNYEDDEA